MLFRPSPAEHALCLTQDEAMTIIQAVAKDHDYATLELRFVALADGGINVLHRCCSADADPTMKLFLSALYAVFMDRVEDHILAADARNAGRLN